MCGWGRALEEASSPECAALFKMLGQFGTRCSAFDWRRGVPSFSGLRPYVVTRTSPSRSKSTAGGMEHGGIMVLVAVRLYRTAATL